MFKVGPDGFTGDRDPVSMTPLINRIKPLDCYSMPHSSRVNTTMLTGSIDGFVNPLPTESTEN